VRDQVAAMSVEWGRSRDFRARAVTKPCRRGEVSS